MESLIKLTVKTPNQRIGDIEIVCELEWSVRRLKEYLQDVYPSKPDSSSQKLIYLGKLLQDHDLLKEVFGDWGARTLHLVCAETASTSDEAYKEKEIAGPSVAATTPTTTSSDGAQDATDGLRYRGTNYYSVPSNLTSMHSPFMSVPNMSQWQHYYHQHQGVNVNSWSHQQSTDMQQYYQQWFQWQMVMHQQLSQRPHGQHFPSMPSFSHFHPPTPPPAATPQAPPTPQSPAQPAQQGQHQPQEPVEAAVNNQNRNVPQVNAGMGGAIGAADDDENENPQNRDWLDWLYMSMRMLMLFSIIYFYSSTTRFILVALLGFLMYLYQAGWLTARVEQRQLQEQGADQQQRNNDEEQGDNLEGENISTDNVDGNDTNRTDVTAQQPPQPGVLRVLCTFFVSFVTSLIPTAPPALQQQ